MTITHPRLAHAILALRPNAKPLADFLVEDNGKGPTLRDGSMKNPPTQQEVDALTEEQLDRAQAMKNGLPPVSDRQFFQALAVSGLITQEEALAAVATGAVPATLQTLITALPQADRFGAKMLLAGATLFHRDHPMTVAFGQMYGWSPSQVDELWLKALSL